MNEEEGEGKKEESKNEDTKDDEERKKGQGKERRTLGLYKGSIGNVVHLTLD